MDVETPNTAARQGEDAESAPQVQAYKQIDLTFGQAPSKLASVNAVDGDRPGNFWRQAQWYAAHLARSRTGL